jgi:hypothetical protein
MSRIIEFRKSAQKAEKQSVQGKTCAFTGHRPQSLPFGFDESDKRCASLKSVMRDQIVALIENEGVTHTERQKFLDFLECLRLGNSFAGFGRLFCL